jgi:O-succinylbenzoic acid--CoA ligase
MGKIPCPLEAAAKAFGPHPAIVSGEKVISFLDYHHMALSVGLGLAEQHIEPGQRVAIMADTCWEYVILLQALFKLGAVACPMSPRFPEKSLLEILERINCCTAIDPSDKLSPKASRHVRKIGLNALSVCRPTKKTGGGDTLGVKTDLDGDATIILTSGTSGVPKAALHTYGNHYYSALGSNKNMTVQPGDRWLLSLPLYHVGGLGIVFRMVLGGATVVIPEGRQSIGTAVEQYGITHVSLVSTQLYRWLKEGVSSQTTGRLKAVLVGGGPVPVSLVTESLERGLPLFATYGSTEMASQVTTTAPWDTGSRLFTSGKILDYRDMKIDRGEILVKGKTLFKGYVDREKTTLPLDEEGWFRTGDLSRLDDEGYITFLGRKDNMFISGGENITPEEIEGQLCMLPEIMNAVVVPVEDREFGFRPVAFVQMSGNKDMDQEGFVADLAQHLPRFKIPVAFYQWPKEAAHKGGMKPDRRYLIRLAEQLNRNGERIARSLLRG